MCLTYRKCLLAFTKPYRVYPHSSILTLQFAYEPILFQRFLRWDAFKERANYYAIFHENN